MYDDEPRNPEDLDVGTAILVVSALLVLAVLVAGAFGLIPSCSPQGQEAVPGSHILTVDTSNAALMHAYGLPTKEDAMHYHMLGQWGYWSDGALFAFDELPGDSGKWDELYGIDSDNPAFDK